MSTKSIIFACLLAALATASQASTGWMYVDGVNYDYNTSTLQATVVQPENYSKYPHRGDLVIPVSVTSGRFTFEVVAVDSRAFMNCESLNSVTFQSSNGRGVTSIGESAFSGCTKLTKVVLPPTLTSLGERAFYMCSSLPELTIPDGITSVGRLTFSYCSSLSHITLPAVMEEGGIGREAFLSSGLTEITIPRGVVKAGKSAFSHCKKLSQVHFPDDYRVISTEMFTDCYSLSSITFPPNLFGVEISAFFGCPFKSFTIPASVVYFHWESLYGCDMLQEIIIEDSSLSLNGLASTIDDDNLENVHSLYLGRNLTNIDEFLGMANLEYLAIGSNVTDLSYSFGDNLKEIEAYSKTPNKVKEAFNGTVKARAILRVYASAYDAYCQAPGWRDFFYIEKMPDTDGIAATRQEESPTAAPFFHLTGQQANGFRPGNIYVTTGKKVLVK